VPGPRTLCRGVLCTKVESRVNPKKNARAAEELSPKGLKGEKHRDAIFVMESGSIA